MVQNRSFSRGPALVGWLLLAYAVAVLTGRLDPSAWAVRLSTEPPGGTITVDGGARTLDDPLMRAAVTAVTAALGHDGAVSGPVRTEDGGHAVAVTYRLAGADWRTVRTDWRAVRATLAAVRAAYPQLHIAHRDRMGTLERLLGHRAALLWLLLGGLLVAACAAADRRTTARRTQAPEASSTASVNVVATGRPVAYRSGGSVKPPAYSTHLAPTSAAA
jgi:hypothetical protein